jgi:hypothetical protein
MAITSFSTDYSERLIDINILKVAAYIPNTQIPVTVEFGNPSQYIAGINKLVQKYAIMFLTKVGSQINTSDFGTEFLLDLQNRSNLTRLNVLHLFNFANLDVLAVFRGYQSNNPSIPADEQLKSATMSSFSVTGSTLNLSIAITSIAGDSVVFILPVPLN